MNEETTLTMHVVIEEDPETGELMLPIPIDILNQMGWDIDDELEFEDMMNGTFLMRKTETDLEIEEDEDEYTTQGV